MKAVKRKKKILIITAAVLAGAAAAFLIYFSFYYHAEPEALEALVSDEEVLVERTDFGWYFDGPSERDLYIFYPGAKVEAASYAPFMKCLAANGLDACLVEMPFHFALFGTDKADAVLARYAHERVYIGGHSLGGVAASRYASSHSDRLSGVIFCASYPAGPLSGDLTEISVYGSEDQVLNIGKLRESRQYAPDAYYEYVIEGGNHAGFGNYGEQKGDGAARITAGEQQLQAARLITECTSGKNL